MLRVSVVIPVYNGEKYLVEAIQSVLYQTYEDWELLLVDDGSTDMSVTIIREYASCYPRKVRYLEHPGRLNRGQFSTRVLGASRARTGIIALLDQDDIWDENYLKKHLSIWAKVESQNVALSYGPSLYWFSDDPTGAKDFVQKMPTGGQRTYSPGALLEPFFASYYANTPCPSCALIRREVFSGVGKFESAARGSAFEDQYLWWYTAARWPIAVHCYVWVRYRQHSQSAMIKLNSSPKQSCLAELRFLRAIKEDLQTVCPQHPLLISDEGLVAQIRSLRKKYVQEILRSRFPARPYNNLRLAYWTARAKMKRLFQ